MIFMTVKDSAVIDSVYLWYDKPTGAKAFTLLEYRSRSENSNTWWRLKLTFINEEPYDE
jgi:hypothetical protein